MSIGKLTISPCRYHLIEALSSDAWKFIASFLATLDLISLLMTGCNTLRTRLGVQGGWSELILEKDAFASSIIFWPAPLLSSLQALRTLRIGIPRSDCLLPGLIPSHDHLRALSQTLVELKLDFVEGLSDAHAPCLPRSLSRLLLPHNTLLTDSGILELPTGLLALDLRRNRKISGAAALPRELELFCGHLEQFRPSDATFADMPHFLTSLTLDRPASLEERTEAEILQDLDLNVSFTPWRSPTPWHYYHLSGFQHLPLQHLHIAELGPFWGPQKDMPQDFLNTSTNNSAASSTSTSTLLPHWSSPRVDVQLSETLKHLELGGVVSFHPDSISHLPRHLERLIILPIPREELTVLSNWFTLPRGAKWQEKHVAALPRSLKVLNLRSARSCYLTPSNPVAASLFLSEITPACLIWLPPNLEELCFYILITSPEWEAKARATLPSRHRGRGGGGGIVGRSNTTVQEEAKEMLDSELKNVLPPTLRKCHLELHLDDVNQALIYPTIASMPENIEESNATMKYVEEKGVRHRKAPGYLHLPPPLPSTEAAYYSFQREAAKAPNVFPQRLLCAYFDQNQIFFVPPVLGKALFCHGRFDLFVDALPQRSFQENLRYLGLTLPEHQHFLVRRLPHQLVTLDLNISTLMTDEDVLYLPSSLEVLHLSGLGTRKLTDEMIPALPRNLKEFSIFVAGYSTSLTGDRYPWPRTLQRLRLPAAASKPRLPPFLTDLSLESPHVSDTWIMANDTSWFGGVIEKVVGGGGIGGVGSLLSRLFGFSSSDQQESSSSSSSSSSSAHSSSTSSNASASSSSSFSSPSPFPPRPTSPSIPQSLTSLTIHEGSNISGACFSFLPDSLTSLRIANMRLLCDEHIPLLPRSLRRFHIGNFFSPSSFFSWSIPSDTSASFLTDASAPHWPSMLQSIQLKAPLLTPKGLMMLPKSLQFVHLILRTHSSSPLLYDLETIRQCFSPNIVALKID